MKFLLFLIFSIFVLLQYALWVNADGLKQMRLNEKKIAKLKNDFNKLDKRNTYIKQEIDDLQQNSEAILEIARKNLGYIKKGEIFYKLQN